MKAVHASFLWSNRAGLWSMNPSITVINVVDDRQSPAFRVWYDVIPLLREGVYGNAGLFSLSLVQTLRRMPSDLERIFEKGLASPYDHTEDGETLISVSPSC